MQTNKQIQTRPKKNKEGTIATQYNSVRRKIKVKINNTETDCTSIPNKSTTMIMMF